MVQMETVQKDSVLSLTYIYPLSPKTKRSYIMQVASRHHIGHRIPKKAILLIIVKIGIMKETRKGVIFYGYHRQIRFKCL